MELVCPAKSGWIVDVVEVRIGFTSTERSSACVEMSLAALTKALSRSVARIAFSAAMRALEAAVVLKPCSDRPPVAGMASGRAAAPEPKRGTPAVDVITGNVGFIAATSSAMRPPQPVALGPDDTDDCHCNCWSECEKRLSGRLATYEA